MTRFINTFRNIRFRTMAATMLICFIPGISSSQGFDPVNDDTDIFLANPTVAAQRPNVLLYVDNTANWNTAFANEQSALAAVVNSLSDQFNLGLMLFPETGTPNDTVDGGYVRFAIRQMTDANKTVLAELVNDLSRTGDAGNNNTLSLGMLEVYRYFSGGNSRASHGKIKSDYRGNATHEATIANLGEYALPASPTSSSSYNSPAVDSCQSNFVIYLSNGGANENSAALAVAEAELADLGYDTSSTIALDPDGQEGSWMDEYAKYMANADISSSLSGTQHATFYVVEVDPVTTGTGDDMTALMKSVALNGNGQYFAVSSGNGGQAIVNALQEIFTEIQAVNSVFASTTLPVSVNVRGTNLNQVYIGVFRPDETKSPRWFGNLKMYKLGFDSATGTLFLADAATAKAENPETGFINANSASFWTGPSTFWSFRTPDENGAGGVSDEPDGDLVEKGGTAQLQRTANISSQASRNLYTCTGACTSGSSLSATPFTTANANITPASLSLGVVAVSTLTGFDTKSVTTIKDIIPVSSLNTASGGASITGLNTSAVGKTITNLTTISTKTITAMTNNPVEKTFNDLRAGSGPGVPKDPVWATINNHGYTNGQVVHITGVGSAVYNGSKIITLVDANRFKYSTGDSNPTANPTITSAKATTTSTIVTVTVPSHGLSSGDAVTIAGITPTDFNGTYSSISRINDNSFTVTTASALPPITSISGASITANSTTATATVTSHGLSGSVVISDATVNGYNGTHTITSTGANTFTFPVGTAQTVDSSSTGRAYIGTATVTALASGHGFANGQIVSISGANPSSYNGSFAISNVVAGVSFQYTAPGAAANTSTSMNVSAGTSNTVTATVPNHNFSFGDVILVAGAEPTDYNGVQTITSVVDANTFKYTVGTTPDPADPSRPATVRLNSPTAIATVTAHGYTTGNLITIKGATPAGFNRNDIAITVLDANTFKYAITSAQNTTATGTITSSKKGLTAKVRAVNHGFATNANVGIAGAVPSGFNGSFDIIKVDDNNFTYTLASAQGDGTGTITASSGTGSTSARSNLINWVRGADNQEDENANSSATDVRSSIQGDVLHSRPAVINYNRHGNDDDVYVFFGSNDGIFRAVKGGFAQSDDSEPLPGQEAWGFIPPEFFSSLQRLRNNEPKISSGNKKPYFADGTITVLAEDNSGPDGEDMPDGMIDVTVDDNDNPDRVILFISMRRGGRFLYALDVSDPAVPKLLWKKTNTDAGFAELGQTWSAPTIVTSSANSGEPMLMFGAGYDPAVEDLDPATISAVTASTVTADSADYPRTMGRGIFALDATTGDILWQAGPEDGDPGTGHPYVEVTGMDYAIPSDLVTISDRASSVDNRAYVGDTGGNMWRVDLAAADPEDWKVTRLAAIADTSGLPADKSGLRKFLFPPDVVYATDGYDAVLLGSGDREHPFDTTVENRFYMFKDTGIAANTPLIDTTVDTNDDGTISVVSNNATLAEADLFDATTNCIQSESDCIGTGDETDADTAADALNSADGWYITLTTGEKVVGNSVTLNNVVFFNTNIPETALAVSNCASNLGEARQYKVNFQNATSFQDVNIDGSTDADDRYTVHTGGGYLPSPVPVVVEIDGEIHEGVISGVAVDDPPGSALNARLRKFWNKEVDE